MSKSLLSQNKPISTAPVRVQQTKLTSSLSSAALSSNQQKLSSNTAVNPSVAGDTVVSEITEHHKIPKPPASEVANKIFSILFISDPITVVEICKQLPEVPRESIQSVLEVLQVLGLICQSSILKEPTSSRSSATNMIFLYSLTDYAKFSSAFPINNLETEVKSKQKAIVEVEARNNQLQVNLLLFTQYLLITLLYCTDCVMVYRIYIYIYY